MTSYICIGKGKTDANGVAQLTHDCQGNQLQTPGYTGQGKGKLNIIASTDGPSVIDSGSVVSQPYTVIDSLFLDTISNHNTKWWSTEALNVDTTGTDGILVKNEATSGYVLDYNYLTDNFPSSWSDRNNAVKCWELPFCVEFDLVSCSDLSACGIFIGDDSANLHTYFSSLNITTGSVKIEVTGTKVFCYMEGEQVSESNLSIGTCRFAFRINASNNIKYNNLRAYPI